MYEALYTEYSTTISSAVKTWLFINSASADSTAINA